MMGVAFTLSRSLAAIAALALLGASARAEIWRVAPSDSEIAFDYVEDGAPQSGRFTRFSGRGSFTQGYPDDAELELVIEIPSIVLTDDFRTDFVQTPTWFDAESHPTARYQLISLSPIGDDRYAAEGELTIKGVTRPVSTEIALAIDSSRAEASGALAFKRSDFNVGDSAAGIFIDIEDDVTVRFDIVADGR